MKFIAGFLTLCFFSLNVLAQASSVAPASEAKLPELQDAKSWSVEGQYSTLSNSKASTFGPSLLYAVDLKNQLGLRFLAPTTSAETGAASAMAVYRHLFSEAKTSLFGEFTLGENAYNYDSSTDSVMGPSVGTNFGIIHHLNADLAFGGIVGLEWTKTAVFKSYAENTDSGTYGYGRLALFGSVNF